MINAEETKKNWIEYYKELLKKYENTKQAMEIPFCMFVKYDSLSTNEQLIIHEVLKDWLLSDDDGGRSMARRLIRENHISNLIPFVEKGIKYLKTLPQDVHLKYEIKDLQRLLKELKNSK